MYQRITLCLLCLFLWKSQSYKFDFYPWKSTEANECGGKWQSPIKINTEATNPSRKFSFIRWEQTQKGDEFLAKNIGGTIDVNTTSARIVLKVSNKSYVLQGYHFIWSKYDYEGSDHIIDEEEFPLEVQFVHWRETYGSYENALDKSDGIAVLSVLFKEVDEAKTTLVDGLLPKDMGPLQELGGEVQMTAFDVSKEVMKYADLSQVYSYRSLIGKKCTKYIEWMVVAKPVEVTKSQLAEIRKVKFYDGRLSNLRRPKPLGDRNVIRNFCL